MDYHLKTVVSTNARSMIERNGDAIWEWLCDSFPDPFRLDVAADKSGMPDSPIAHYARVTRKDAIRAVLKNVQAEYADRPLECPVRLNGVFWRV